MARDSEAEISLSQIAAFAVAGSAGEDVLAKVLLEKAMAAIPQKLSGPLSKEDQEDVALSAVKSVCLGLRSGKVEYRGDKQLFALLHTVIESKIRKLWQYHFAQKRDIRRAESLESSDTLAQAEIIPSPQPIPLDSIHVTPEEQAVVDRILVDLQSELHGLFGSLLNELDEHPRKLLLTLLETDASNKELSQMIGRSIPSIERYRQLIRTKVLRYQLED